MEFQSCHRSQSHPGSHSGSPSPQPMIPIVPGLIEYQAGHQLQQEQQRMSPDGDVKM